MDNLKGKITIGTTTGRDGQWVEIKLRDTMSGKEIVRVKMSHQDWAMATIGSLAMTECSYELSNVEKAGKKKITDTIDFQLPKGTPYSNQCKVALDMATRLAPEGWVVEDSFQSQSSFKYNVDGTLCHARIAKYIEAEG